MKIAVIGAGAMGGVYGAGLSGVPENEVFLIDIWQEHVKEINENGLQIEENEVLKTYKNLKAETDVKKVGICDMAIIFVKSTDTKEAVEGSLAVFGEDTIALTLQNGVGNVEIISEIIGSKNVIAGTTAHGATVLSAGKMRHAGKGKTVIGELDGNDTVRVAKIRDMFEKAGIETEISNNVFGRIWDKLLINVGINALTGITKLRNGELLEHPEIIDIMEKAVTEAMKVAEAKEIKLSFADPVAQTKNVCVATAKNKASMLQDILNHRQTEIDMINGAIVREGSTLGIETPVNSVLTNLIKFFQK